MLQGQKLCPVYVLALPRFAVASWFSEVLVRLTAGRRVEFGGFGTGQTSPAAACEPSVVGIFSRYHNSVMAFQAYTG